MAYTTRFPLNFSITTTRMLSSTTDQHHQKHLSRIYVNPEFDAINFWEAARILFPCKLAVEIFGLLIHAVGLAAMGCLKRPLKLHHLLLINLAVSASLVLFVSFLNSVIVIWQQTTAVQTTPGWHHFRCSDDVIADILRHAHLLPLFAISGVIINQHVAGTAQSMYQYVVTRTKVLAGIIGIYVFNAVIYALFHIASSSVHSYEDCFTRYNGPYIMGSNWYLGTLSIFLAAVDIILLFRLCSQSKKLLNTRRPKEEKVIQIAEFTDLKKLHEFNITVAWLFTLMTIFSIPSVSTFFVIGAVTSKGELIDNNIFIGQTVCVFFTAMASLVVPLMCARRLCDVQSAYNALWGHLRGVFTQDEHVPMPVASASAEREIEETLC